LINLDFADVRTVMSGMGTAMMGTGEASGQRRAIVAAEEAITNPLLDDVSLKGARGLLLSIIGGKDMTLYEVDEAASRVRQEIDAEANIIVGASFDEAMGDRLRVSIVASGMARSGEAYVAPGYSAGAAQHRAAPPPLPGGTQSPPESLAHLLSKVLDQPPPGLHQAPLPAAHEPSIWQAPGNVTIQQKLPSLGLPSASNQTVTQAPATTKPLSEPFTPRPTQELQQPRRMPEIEDFPPVGQREYRARAATPVSQSGAGPRVYKGQAAPSGRKPGLFERLTSLGRGSSDSRQTAVGSYPQAASRAPQSTAGTPVAGSTQRPHHEPHKGSNKHTQQSELPVFFSRERS
jgi:cell division protein FtsZ